MTKKTLLLLRTSLFSTEGQSSRLAAEFAERWLAQNPGAVVISRDLARDPIPHLDAARFEAFVAKPGERTTEQQAFVHESDALIDELRRADVVVIGLPMYNFSVPSTLKAYFDHIARAGVTFRYTEKGAQGLLRGKKAYVFATRGGRYAPQAEHQSAFVRQFLGFVGLDDVEFVYAEGLALGEPSRSAALSTATSAIDRLAASHLPLAA
ncbi:MAG TPA: FMN-dependent NADH-azoreductase [Burkholderiales bacterium]|nr:FMN-dependent NADH-azoreductase [Burkholderiales bacterium]